MSKNPESEKDVLNRLLRLILVWVRSTPDSLDKIDRIAKKTDAPIPAGGDADTRMKKIFDWCDNREGKITSLIEAIGNEDSPTGIDGYSDPYWDVLDYWVGYEKNKEEEKKLSIYLEKLKEDSKEAKKLKTKLMTIIKKHEKNLPSIITPIEFTYELEDPRMFIVLKKNIGDVYRVWLGVFSSSEKHTKIYNIPIDYSDLKYGIQSEEQIPEMIDKNFSKFSESNPLIIPRVSKIEMVLEVENIFNLFPESWDCLSNINYTLGTSYIITYRFLSKYGKPILSLDDFPNIPTNFLEKDILSIAEWNGYENNLSYTHWGVKCFSILKDDDLLLAEKILGNISLLISYKNIPQITNPETIIDKIRPIDNTFPQKLKRLRQIEPLANNVILVWDDKKYLNELQINVKSNIKI